MAALSLQSARPSNMEALRRLTYREVVPVSVNPFADVLREQPVAVLSFDDDLRVTGAYGAGLDRVGLSSRDEGRSAHAVFDGDDQVYALARRAMADGTSDSTVSTVRGRPVRCRIGRSRCAGGLMAGLIWVEDAR